MKRLQLYFFLIILFITLQNTYGQCKIAIPQNTTIVQSRTVAYGASKKNPKYYWVCNNGDLEIVSRKAVVFLESGCSLKITGGSVKVYARTNSTVQVTGFGKCEAVYENGARLLTTMSSALLKRINACNIIEYDFTNAPKGICPTVNPEEVVDISTPTPTPNTPYDPSNDNTNTNNDNTNTNNQPSKDNPYGHLTDTIPSIANVISNQNVNTSQAAVYWVCPNATISHNGSNATFYLESNASLTLNGSNNIVYMKKGSSLMLRSGARNQVQYEDGANLRMDNGIKTKFLKIPNLKYHYDTAPSNGCK